MEWRRPSYSYRSYTKVTFAQKSSFYHETQQLFCLGVNANGRNQVLVMLFRPSRLFRIVLRFLYWIIVWYNAEDLRAAHRGIEHRPLNEKTTYVGHELFHQYKRLANNDRTGIKFLDLKNQLKLEMQNIVTLLLGSLRVHHDESRHRKGYRITLSDLLVFIAFLIFVCNFSQWTFIWSALLYILLWTSWLCCSKELCLKIFTLTGCLVL